MQAAVLLNEIDDVLDAFANAVTDDQQQELTPPEMAGDVVHEDALFNVGIGRANQIEEHVAWPFQRPGHLALQVLVAPRGDFLRIVENLTDDFPARLRVAPELEFGQRQAAQRVDVESIHVARRRG